MYIPIRNIAKRGRDFIAVDLFTWHPRHNQTIWHPLLKARDHRGLVSRIEMASVSRRCGLRFARLSKLAAKPTLDPFMGARSACLPAVSSAAVVLF